MFLTRLVALSPINGFLSNLADQLRFKWRDQAMFIALILFANYVGFVWALTGLDSFYGDAFFFFDVSVNLIFVIGLSFGIMQLILAALALLLMIVSIFRGNEVMRLNRYIRFKIPVTNVRALEAAISFSVFFLVFMILYTDFNWWQLILFVLIVPLIVAIWSGIIWYVVKNHKNDHFDVDLGLYFEKGAIAVQDLAKEMAKIDAYLEEALLSVLPDSIRPQAERLLDSVHRFNKMILDEIPDQEVVHAEITQLQARWQEIRWEIAYARFALPQLKAMVFAAVLALATLAGHAHEQNYVAHHAAELTLNTGETKIITPLVARGPWQYYVENGTVRAANKESVVSLTILDP